MPNWFDVNINLISVNIIYNILVNLPTKWLSKSSFCSQFSYSHAKHLWLMILSALCLRLSRKWTKLLLKISWRSAIDLLMLKGLLMSLPCSKSNGVKEWLSFWFENLILMRKGQGKLGKTQTVSISTTKPISYLWVTSDV